MNGISLVAKPLTSFDNAPIEFTLPTLTKVHKPSKLEILWRKICDFVAKIWKKICFWKSDFQLSRRDVTELRNERLKKSAEAKDVKPIERKRLIRHASSKFEVALRPHAAFHPVEDPSLSDMCTFFEEFSNILVNKCLYKETIQDAAVPKWKETCLEKITQLHPLIDNLLNLQNAIKPFFGKMEGTTNLIFVLQQLIHVLFSQFNSDNDSQKKTEEMLLERMNTLKEDGEISGEYHKQILASIHPILDGLFTSQNWLINSEHPLMLLRFISDTLTFFNTFADLLKNEEFEETLKEITTQIDNSFENDIREIFEMNTKPIACYLSGRLSELIKSLPHSIKKEETDVTHLNVFNELFEVIEKHVEGWIDANETKKNWEGKISKSKNDSLLEISKQVHVEAQNEAEQLLKNVKDRGGEKKFLEKKFHEAFGASESEICHSIIQDRIFSNNKAAHAGLNDDYHENLVKRLIPYILPEQSTELPDGKKIKIKGITALLKQIKLPRNFKKIKHRLKDIFKGVIDKGTYEDKENFEKYIFPLAETIMANDIHERVEKAIKEGLITLTKRLTSKEYLNKLAADNILPALFDKIFQSWVRITIQQNVSTMDDYFLKITEPKNTIFQTKRRLIATLNELLEAQSIDFQFTVEEVDKISCDLYAAPSLLDDRSFFKQKIKSTLSDVIKYETMEFPLKQEEIDQVSDLFYDIVLAERKSSLSQIDLFNEVYTLMKEQNSDFQWEEEQIDKTRFAELSKPIFTEIFQHLKSIFVKNVPEKELTKNEVNTELKNYFNLEKVPDQPVYGRLVSNLLYKAANVGIDTLFQNPNLIKSAAVKLGIVSSYVISKISESFCITMQKITCSHDFIVTSSVEAAKRTLLDADKVYEVFFNPEPSHEGRKKIQKETEQRLKQNILRISILTRDTLKLLLPGFCLLSSVKISELIGDLFDNLFCRPEINKSLLLNAFDVIDSNLAEAVIE